MKALKWTTLVSAVVLLAMVGAAGVSAQDDAPPQRISVGGFGSVTGTPDIAVLQLGVEFVNADVVAAFTQANDTFAKVLTELNLAGIPEEDIQTVSFNIFPEERFNPQGPTSEPQRVFRARNVVSVTIRDVEQTGDIITAAVNAGANNVFGLNFGIDDTSALEAEAREAAIANARERAEQLAEALGVAVGAPVNVSEGAQMGGFPPQAFAFGIGGGGGGPAIMEGQLTISVQVQVTFELVPAE